MKSRKVKSLQTHIGVRVNNGEVTTSPDAGRHRVKMELLAHGVLIESLGLPSMTLVPFANIVQIFLEVEEEAPTSLRKAS